MLPSTTPQLRLFCCLLTLLPPSIFRLMGSLFSHIIIFDEVMKHSIDYHCYNRHSEEPAQWDQVITSRSNYLAPVTRFIMGSWLSSVTIVVYEQARVGIEPESCCYATNALATRPWHICLGLIFWTYTTSTEMTVHRIFFFFKLGCPFFSLTLSHTLGLAWLEVFGGDYSVWRWL